MAFDYKKEYKEFYMPKGTPSIVTVPKMNYIAVRGSGNPNDADGEYKQAIGLLYGIAFTIKMSKKEDHQIDGYFDYVVPPLEGFWWQEGVSGIDYARKEDFKWISVIRLPDFVTREDFDWAVRKAMAKKKQDFSKVEFFSYEEGLCIQCMHIGAYDDEPATVDAMHRFMEEQGYTLDITDQRMHHEIYLSDARRVAPEKLKTVVRHVFTLYKMPGSYGCLVFNKLYPTDTETAIPSHEETVRILEEIRIYGQNTHKQTSDHEHINKLICWYSKNICQSKDDEPQNNRVAESAYILRAYISPCKNCSICEYDCERILDLSIPVIEANNIRGPCIPVDLTKFEKEFFDYE